MGLQLHYPDLTLTEGEIFYPEDGAKAPGSLLLYDFSNPLCIPEAQATAANPVNLGADTLRAVIGDPAYTYSIGQGDRMSMSPGRGAYLAPGTYPAGTRMTGANPSGDFTDYLVGGGTPATQPDLVFIGWYRPPEAGFEGGTIGRWGTLSNSASLFYVNYSGETVSFRGGGQSVSRDLAEAGPDGLVQFAVSRSELFLNGQKAADFDATRIAGYDTWLNNMGGSSPNYFFMNEAGGGNITIPGARWYRFALEDYVASGRTALEAVKADYDYVMATAPFVQTV